MPGDEWKMHISGRKIFWWGAAEENLGRKSAGNLGGHAGSGWGRVNFLPISWYGVALWICGGNSMDNTGMLWLSLSSACTVLLTGFLLLLLQSQSLFCPSSSLTSEGAWGARGLEGAHLAQLLPADQRDVPCWVLSCSVFKSGEEEIEIFRKMPFVFQSHC